MTSSITEPMRSALASTFNGVLLFGAGTVAFWAVGYLIGVVVAKGTRSDSNRRKSTWPDALGFIGLCVGATVLKDLVFK